MTFLVKEALSMSTVNEDDRVRNVAEGLWLKVLKDFDNETVHTVFIDYCIATHQLPRAGANYRTYREQKGNTLLIDTCMKKIVLSAQVSYLPDRKKGGGAQRSPFSRLFAAALFLMSGCIAVALWIAFPALRIVLLMGVAIVLAGGMYQLKRKL
jgi:hypothetical protein